MREPSEAVLEGVPARARAGLAGYRLRRRSGPAPGGVSGSSFARLVAPAVGLAYRAKRRPLVDRFFAAHPGAADALLRLLGPFKTSSVRDGHGHLLELPPDDYLGLRLTGVYEPEVTAFFRRSARPGDTALDLGAHVGYFTLLLAKLVGPRGRVVAFEPHPENFALLSKNVRENGYGNVSLYQAAVAERSGRGWLLSEPSSSFCHRLGQAPTDPSAIEVDTVALDEELAGLAGTIRWVKMDVEGAEVAALRGMERVIQSSRPLSLVVELFPRALARSGSSPQELLQFLDERGFLPHRLGLDGVPRPTTAAELLRIHGKHGTHENVVFQRPR